MYQDRSAKMHLRQEVYVFWRFYLPLSSLIDLKKKKKKALNTNTVSLSFPIRSATQTFFNTFIIQSITNIDFVKSDPRCKIIVSSLPALAADLFPSEGTELQSKCVQCFTEAKKRAEKQEVNLV